MHSLRFYFLSHSCSFFTAIPNLEKLEQTWSSHIHREIATLLSFTLLRTISEQGGGRRKRTSVSLKNTSIIVSVMNSTASISYHSAELLWRIHSSHSTPKPVIKTRSESPPSVTHCLTKTFCYKIALIRRKISSDYC